MRNSQLVTALAFALSLPAQAQAQVVRLPQGILHGATKAGVEEYLAIPYAAAPVGPLRWRDTRAASPWSGVRAATNFSAGCMQKPGGSFGPFTRAWVHDGPTSEDCLYLNVWSPGTRSRKLPVLLYIHGGGFGSGSTSIPVYNGAGLARKGAVVVTINYRLGAFGFLAHPALTAESPLHSSGNLGLLDAIAALKWARDNIAKFGGDPANITIAGQSAGAAAVSDLLASPLAKGLFSKAIIQSGPAMGVDTPTLAAAEAVGRAVGERLGAATPAALRGLPAERVLAATATPPPSDGPSGVPTISMKPNLDGVVIARNQGETGAPFVSDVPILAGYNKDEAFIFGTPKVSPDQFIAYVRSRYGDFADRFLAVYPHATAQEASRALDELGRDRYMAGLTLWADEHARSGRAPIFLYRFDHPYPDAEKHRFGAFHTAEVPYIFGALAAADPRPGDDDRRVSSAMQSWWLAFMQNSSPRAAGLPAWQSWQADPGHLMVIDTISHMDWSTSSADRFKVFKEYVSSGGRLSLF